MLLYDSRTGLPLPTTTRYSALYRRSANGSVSTMEKELRAIALGLEWAERNGIDLDERIGSMTLFTPGELVSLRDFMRVNQKGGKPVHPLVRYSRCLFFRDYVTWLAQDVTGRIPPGARYLGAKEKLADFQTQPMKMLKPGNTYRPARRKGMTPEQEARLREVIVPGHPDNPFRRKHQVRNHALLLSYIELGIRLSEALVIKGRDLVLAGSHPTVTIHRRADDPDDKRALQPLVKTAGRILPLGAQLVSVLTEWMLRHRPDPKRYPGAKRLPYVFVSEDGNALSMSAVKDMFRLLRKRVGQSLEGIGDSCGG